MVAVLWPQNNCCRPSALVMSLGDGVCFVGNMRLIVREAATMRPKVMIRVCVVAGLTGPAYAVELPPEITPAIREACESDVRRLCIRPESTEFAVKLCVLRKVDRLNATCRRRLSDAGLIDRARASLGE